MIAVEVDTTATGGLLSTQCCELVNWDKYSSESKRSHLLSGVRAAFPEWQLVPSALALECQIWLRESLFPSSLSAPADDSKRTRAIFQTGLQAWCANHCPRRGCKSKFLWLAGRARI